MKAKLFITAVATLALTASAFATDSNDATIVFTGSVAPSIHLAVSGNADATGALGTVQKFGGDEPTGWNRTNSSTTAWSLDSSFQVVIDGANLETGTSFDLKAVLNSAPATGVTYSFNNVAVTASQGNVITAGSFTSQNYSAAHPVKIDILDSAAHDASLARTMTLTVSAN